MLTRWHIGALHGFDLWWVLVTSPEVLVFLFFMITDPKTTPRSSSGRIVYGVSLGLLAAILIAPTTSEFAAKVALLLALSVVSLALLVLRLVPKRIELRWRLAAPAAIGLAVAAIVVADATPIPTNVPALSSGPLPPIKILPPSGNLMRLDMHTAELIAYTVLKARPSARSDRFRIFAYSGGGQSSPGATVYSHKEAYGVALSPNGTWTFLG